MSGASEGTKRVQVVNANWEAGGDGEDGRFSFMIVTVDSEHHVVTPSPAAAAALVAILGTDAVCMWDEDNRTLIAGGVVGHWFN